MIRDSVETVSRVQFERSIRGVNDNNPIEASRLFFRRGGLRFSIRSEGGSLTVVDLSFVLLGRTSCDFSPLEPVRR